MNKLQIPFAIREKVQEQLVYLKTLKYPAEYICSGHDMVRLLSALTIDYISTQKSGKYDEEHITDLLILAYHIEPSKTDQLNKGFGLIDMICDNSVVMGMFSHFPTPERVDVETPAYHTREETDDGLKDSQG